MRRARIALLMLLSTLAAACGSGVTTGDVSAEPVLPRLPADADAPTGAWVAGVNAAGWQFHRSLSGNAVSSPLSLGAAFSLSRAGASQDTGDVLDEIFGLPASGAHSAANAVELAVTDASAETTTIEIANRLFPDDDFAPRREFLETAAQHYGASIEPVDTADGAEAARIVNRWASQQTRGLIPEIVNSDAVQDQRLVLVNTVYLKADWAVPFLADLTSDGAFITDAGSTVSVPFMRDHEPMPRRYVRLDAADAVELPYAGDELAMWVIVPHASDGLAALEASLDASTLAGFDAEAASGMVDLAMPKWEHTLPPADLLEWLCPLGFCHGAGFDGIAQGLFITSAVHGAKVIVDEKGTEAAAATAMVFQESAPPLADLTIVADRPFLWTIVHPDTGALLFVGRVVDPAA